MSNILVTGGLGLIGHRVSKKLLDSGHSVSIVDNRTTYGVFSREVINHLISTREAGLLDVPTYALDIADSSRSSKGWHDLFDRHAPDTVVHLASFPRQKVVNQAPTSAAATMVEGLVALLEVVRLHSVERFVFVSSSMVYGNFSTPVQEDAALSPIGTYGIMKLAGEQIVKDYANRFGFDYTIVRPSAVYGPTDLPGRVVSGFFDQAMSGGVLSVNGINEVLDFTYVEDIADGICLASTVDTARNNTYNITYGEARPIKDAAEIIVGLCKNGSILVGDPEPNFPSRNGLDISKAREHLGYDPTYNLNHGLTEYHRWILNNPPLHQSRA